MRRFLMTLAVLVLLVAVMAVPAMAAEHDHATCNYAGALCADCTAGDHSGWTSLADVSGTTLAAGNYYVPEGGFAGSFTVSSGNVVICLNGSTWSGVTSRTLTVTGNASVTIVDCGDLLEGSSYVTKGVMKGVQLYASTKGDSNQKSSDSTVRGGTIFVEYGAVHFYNGTITGGTAVNGGNVALCGSSGKKAYFYLEGGQIKGAGKNNIKTYNSGGSTVISLEGGGIANNRGGNVFVRNYAEFHMGSAETAKIGDGCAVPMITDGNTLVTQGGNVSVSSGSGKFFMYSGALTNGYATNNGGNFHLESGMWQVSGGYVTGGMGKNSATEFYANVFHNTGTLDMSGGLIDGCYSALNNAVANDAKTVIKLSGTARITGRGMTLQYNSGEGKYNGIPLLRVGDFKPGANIVVAVRSTEYFTNDALKDTLLVREDTSSDTVKSFMKTDMTGDGAITWADYEDATRYIHGLEGNCAVSYEEDGIYLRSVAAGEIYHCVCCGDQPAHYNEVGKIAHLPGCDIYDHPWQRYLIGDNTVLPGATTTSSAADIESEAGYYYLVENEAVEAGASGPDGKVQWATTNQNNFIGTGCWYIDFNGLTMEASSRVASFHNDTATGLVLTNSAATGGIRWQGTYSGHSLFWMRYYEAETACLDKSLNAYHVAFDASDFASKGKLIAVEAGTANFYDCAISGGTIIEETYGGGAIYSRYKGNVNLEGCALNGGTSLSTGGIICFTDNGDLTIKNCAITGGSATTSGGAIYFNAGKLTIENSTISGGTAASGGAIYLSKGTATMTDTVVENSDVYYKGGSLTLSGLVKLSNPRNGLASGIYLASGKKLSFDALDSDSDIILCIDSGSNGTALSNAYSDLDVNCFRLVGSSLYLTADGGVLKLTKTIPADTKVIQSGKLLDRWPARISDGDYVKLLGDFDSVTIPASVALDINGHSLTNVTVADDESIQLFDSSASNYDVPTGFITLAEGQKNPFVREFLTGSIMDRNLRYVTICVDGKYTAHRIYLSVRSTVLYPHASSDKAAIGFRIALRCDEQVAEQVEFGMQVAGDGNPTFVASKSDILGQGSSNDNSRVIAVTFNPETITSTVAEGVISGKACLKFKDNGDEIISSKANTSFKNMAVSALTQYNSLSSTMQLKLDWMRDRYSAVMDSWGVTIAGSQTAKEALDGKKIIFIGNSFTFWGNAVILKNRTILDQESRSNDPGYFYQLCKANGMDVEVTNWTFGSHNITDTFGEACQVQKECVGVDHKQYLVDREFDYVVIQLFHEKDTYAGDLVAHIQTVLDFFRAANPDVKFLFLVPQYAHESNYAWLDDLEDVKKENILICDWGGMLHDIVQGNITVPNATQEYLRSTFVIYRTEDDGYHENALAGYITALMAYCAITGESAVGQPYSFCGDASLNSAFDLDAYKAKNYVLADSNFLNVFGSPLDMQGLQQLADQYLAKYNAGEE